MIFELFHENELQSFENDIVSFISLIESKALPLPILNIQWTEISNNGVRVPPPAVSNSSTDSARTEAPVHEWDEISKQARGPYAGTNVARSKSRGRSPPPTESRHLSQAQKRSGRLLSQSEPRRKNLFTHKRFHEDEADEKEDVKDMDSSDPISKRLRKRHPPLSQSNNTTPVNKEINSPGLSRKKIPVKASPLQSHRRALRPRKNSHIPDTSVKVGRGKSWSEEENEALRQGVAVYGIGSWQSILQDSRFKILKLNKRSNVNLKDRYRNITKE